MTSIELRIAQLLDMHKRETGKEVVELKVERRQQCDYGPWFTVVTVKEIDHAAKG